MRTNYSDRDVTILGDPGQLPLRLEIRARWTTLIAGLGIAAVCLIAAAVFATQDTYFPAGMAKQLWDLTPIALGAYALYRLVRTLIAFQRRGEAEITEAEVHFAERSLTGGRTWTEPLSAYGGVRWRELRIIENNRRGSSPDRYVHVVELAHADETRCVPLVIWITREDGPRAEWERFAQLLGLPAIDARHGEVNIRAAEDVDKSVQDLAREGKIDTAWDDVPPPPKIDVERLGDSSDPASQQIRLTLHTPAMPKVIGWFMYAASAVLVVVGVINLDLKALFGAVLFGGIPFAIDHISAKRPPRVLLSRSELTFEDRLNANNSFTMPLSAIEAVRISRTQAGHMLGRPIYMSAGGVMLTGDAGEKTIGDGLPADAVEWLRDFIRAAVANA